MGSGLEGSQGPAWDSLSDTCTGHQNRGPAQSTKCRDRLGTAERSLGVAGPSATTLKGLNPPGIMEADLEVGLQMRAQPQPTSAAQRSLDPRPTVTGAHTRVCKLLFWGRFVMRRLKANLGGACLGETSRQHM